MSTSRNLQVSALRIVLQKRPDFRFVGADYLTYFGHFCPLLLPEQIVEIQSFVGNEIIKNARVKQFIRTDKLPKIFFKVIL